MEIHRLLVYNEIPLTNDGRGSMIKTTKDMSWKDINDIKSFTANTQDNKAALAKDTSKILFACVQLFKNFIEGIKALSAYDAASIIISEANWMQKNTFKEFHDSNKNNVKIRIGMVYYLDYGKGFSGELAYFHYGLCIGKRDEKVLIVPMTSGADYFSFCYHPTNNPSGNKKHRQALVSEGFTKDCILKINDTKFISAGRIINEAVEINTDAVREMQDQVFRIEFGNIYQEYTQNIEKIRKLEKKIEKQNEIIKKLKEGKKSPESVDNTQSDNIS